MRYAWLALAALLLGGMATAQQATQPPAPAEVLMVGDYLYDIQAGRNAGIRTALVTHGHDWPFADQADLVFPSFEEIPDVLRGWIAAGG